MNTEAYACYNRNVDYRMQSSSGGVYFLLAKEILKNNGVVFAVCYDENFETVHKEIHTEDELIPSLGSKYVPSRLNDTFKRVKECLSTGYKVLFVGTPCQCVGLKHFLAFECHNLICVDFICHGVPSRIAWRRYLELINSDGKLTSLNMREKSSGWSKYQYSWKLNYGSQNERIVPQNQISYMRGFTSDYYLRPSCYQCKFKGIMRSSDITLGDYWGVWDIQPELDDNKGTSLVLINSQEGKLLFNTISVDLVYSEAPLAQAIDRNPSIVNSAVKTRTRDLFFKKLKSGEDFDKIVEDLSKASLIKRMKSKIKYILKRMKSKI